MLGVSERAYEHDGCTIMLTLGVDVFWLLSFMPLFDAFYFGSKYADIPGIVEAVRLMSLNALLNANWVYSLKLKTIAELELSLDSSITPRSKPTLRIDGKGVRAHNHNGTFKVVTTHNEDTGW